MLLDARISVFDPKFSTLLCLDASGDVGGSKGTIKYEDTPSGCGAGEIDLGLTYAQVVDRGYWATMNLVEISTADDVMTAPINTNTATFSTAEQTAGVKARIYVASTQAYDVTQGEETPQLYLWDGATLTMRVPVWGVGTDGTGPYIAVLAPLTGGGNPTTFGAYGTGTYVGRRRYCGRIIRTESQNQKQPTNVISLVGLTQTLKQAYDTFAISDTDCGTAIYNCINKSAAPRWPFLTVSASSFPTVGQTYTGSYNKISVESMINYILTAIPSGDLWVIRIGHDRVVKLVKLYTQSTNTYTYTRTLAQGIVAFEPLNVDDQRDATALYNSVMVIGDTDPTTKQPVNATAQDATSITNYYQIDAQPVTITGLKTTTDCENAATALLNQNSLASSQFKFRVYTRNDTTVSSSPSGLANGDVVRGIDNVVLTRFDDTGSTRNLVPDSQLLYTSGSTALWALNGLSVSTGAGPGGSNAFQSAIGTGSPSGYHDAVSPYIDVTPGQIITFGGWVNASGVTSGSTGWSIYDQNVAMSYASALQGAGATGVVKNTWKVPAGVTKVVIIADTENCTIALGKTTAWSQPLFFVGTAYTDYTPNLAAPNVYGLAASVVTTIDLVQNDRYQDVTFSAIEPDWNAAMHQRAMALANALRTNTAPPAYVDAYVVSSSAFPPVPSGLVVNVPQFLALFAAGTSVQTVPSSSFTLPANSTTWAWLNSSLSWTLKQDPSIVSGAILYGIFQTSASAVLGYTVKAPIGISNNQPGVSGSAITIPSSGAGSPVIANYVTGATTYGCDLTFTPTWSALQSAIARLRVIAVPHGLATNSTWLYGTSGPWGGGVATADQLSHSGSPVTVHLAHLPTGVACDLYAYLEGYDGSYIYPATNPIATTTAQTFDKAAAPKMPTGATISASSITIGTADVGMHTMLAGDPGFNGLNISLIVRFTLGDSNSPSSSIWGYSYVLGTRAHTTSSPTDPTTYEAHPGFTDQPFGNGSVVVVAAKPVMPGTSLDVAFWIVDAQGNRTNCYQLASAYTVVGVKEFPPVQNPIFDGPTHIKLGGIYLGHLAGDTSGDLTTAIVDGANKRFLHTAMSGGVQDVVSSSGAVNVNPVGGVLNRLPQANHDLQVVTSAVTGTSRNLIADSDFSASAWNTAAAAVYWSDGSSGSLYFSAHYGTNGLTILYNGTGAPAGFLYRKSAAINVTPGSTYTISGYIDNTNVTAGNPSWSVYKSDLSALYAQAYGVPGSKGRWSTTFTVPTGVTQVCVIFDLNNCTIASGTAALAANSPQLEAGLYATSYRSGPMFVSGTGYHDYSIHHPALTSNYDSSGNAKASTMLNTKVMSITNYQGLPAVSFSATTSSITCTVASGTVNRQDGSTLSITGATLNLSGLSANQTIFWVIYASLSTGAVTINHYTSAPTSAQQFLAYQDGVIPIAVGVSYTTPSSGSSSGGGSGGTTNACPAADQRIETLERGVVEARSLSVGEHLRDPEQGWNEITECRIDVDSLFEVRTLEAEPVRVNSTHRMMNLDGDWVYIRTLKPGDRLRAINEQGYVTIKEIAYLGEDDFVAINCERHRYVLGSAYGHNISYN